MATRMQQRRGTAAQWTSTNSGNGPILEVGEIGFESDTGKFKIGDGVNNWITLPYFVDADTLVDGAPGLLNTLNELAAAIGDDPSFFTTVATNLSNHQSDTTNIHGIANTADLATKAYADGAVSTHSSDTTNVHGILDTDDLATKTYVADAVSNATVDQSALAGNGIDWNISTEQFDIASAVTTNDGSQTLTNKTISGTSNSLSNIPNNALDYDSITINGEVVALGGSTTIDALPSQTGQNGKYLTTDGADASWSTIDLSSKQDVIAGVSNLEIGYLSNVTSDIQSQIDSKAPLASPTFTGTVSGVTASMVGLGNVDNTSDANKPVSTATQSALDAKLALSGGTMTGDITLAGAPTQALHAVTKAYVDGVAEGLHIHASCVAATTGNVAIATELEPGDLVDGVTLAEGDRVLVKSQTNAAQNGIYVVQASGAALRAADFNEPQEVDGGDFVFVTGGTTHDNTGWVQTTTNVVTIGTDPIQFTQFSGAGTYLAGTGLQLDDNEFSIDTTTTVDISTAQTLTNKTLTSPNINGATIGGDLIPSADSTYDLGSSTNKFKDLYLAGTTLYLDAATIELHSGNIALGHSGNTTTVPIGGGNHTVATLAGEQTLTNKTIDAASNTISNIPNAALDNSSITINGSSVSLGGSTTIDALPSQTSNSGKYLTTNGTSASWVTIQTGYVPIPTTSVSSNISLSSNNRYFVDTSATRTLTLPASPTAGDEIQIFDIIGSAETNNIIIDSNGAKVNGTVQNLEVDIAYDAVSIIYTGSGYGWKVI